MGLLIWKVLFSFSLPQFPVSRFPFPVSRSRSRSHFPFLLLVKKNYPILRILFFSKTNETNLCKQKFGFFHARRRFCLPCDCRQTRCRWGEIKDKGASLFLNSIIFYPKGQETSGLQVSVWNRSQTPALIAKRKVRIFNQKVIFSNFFFLMYWLFSVKSLSTR